MEHYLAHTDYPLWEVIQKGNGPVNVSTDTHGIMKVLPPKTAEETLAREREEMQGLLYPCFTKRSSSKGVTSDDAKEMWEAIKSRFGGNEESKKNKANDNSKRLGKKEESNDLMTLDGGCVDWTSHSEEEEDYALMACNSSGSDTEVTSCSKECKESYVKPKKLYDEQRAQLSDASIEIQAYTQALKKVEAQLVSHQQGQLWYEEKIRFMKIDLDDKTDVLTYHKKLEITCQSGPDIEIDYSQFTYGPKQSQPSESETQTSDFDTCESLPEPTVNEPKVDSTCLKLIIVTIKPVPVSQAENPPLSLELVRFLASDFLHRFIIDDPNITMEEYIKLQEEKALSCGETFDWQTSTYSKFEYCEEEDDSFTNFETEYPAIVFDDTSNAALSCEPTVNSEIENDKVNMPSFPSPEPTIGDIDNLDFFKDFENEFPAIAYNDDLKSKSDPLIEPSVSSRHIDKFETSLSAYNEEEQNVLYFNDSFPLDVIFPNNIKTDKDNDDNIDITQLSRSNVINIDTKGSNELPRTNHDKINKIFNEKFFIMTLNANIVSWNCLNNGIPLSLLKNLYVPLGIPFDPKRYYKDGAHTKILQRPRTDIDSKIEFLGEAINESFDPLYGNYIELNDLDMPLEPIMNQDDFKPTLDFIDEPTYKSCYEMKFSCMIGYRHVNADFLPSLSINIMTKRFYNSIIKDKGDHEGKNLAGTLINIPIFVGNFSIILGFSITNDVDITSGVVLGMSFCKKIVSCQNIMERFAHGDECERMDE
ncbi:hypothetical protein Tco_0277096 [Tanacetum coccineum]